jgi:hypothetical protein
MNTNIDDNRATNRLRHWPTKRVVLWGSPPLVGLALAVIGVVLEHNTVAGLGLLWFFTTVILGEYAVETLNRFLLWVRYFRIR